MRMFKFNDFMQFALVRVGMNDNFVFSHGDEDVELTICDRDMVWNPASHCFRCGDRFSEQSTVYYDEVNRRPFCEKCKGRKIKPRRGAGVDQTSQVSESRARRTRA